MCVNHVECLFHAEIRRVDHLRPVRVVRSNPDADGLSFAVPPTVDTFATQERMGMNQSLIQLRPRADTVYVSQGYTSLATERDGFIADGPEHGLFIHQTRMLSRYRWLIDGVSPQPVALSNVAQHTWMA